MRSAPLVSKITINIGAFYGRRKPGSLRVTAVDDLWLDRGSHGTGLAAKGLDFLDNLHRLLVGNLAEDNVLTVEP